MPFEQMHPIIHQAAWSAVGAIPGCRFDTISTMAGVSASGLPTRRCRVEFEGWSPSLHRTRVDWSTGAVNWNTGTDAVDPVQSASALLTSMADMLAIQMSRSRAGLALRSAVPLRADGGAPSSATHMITDASMLAMMIERHMHQGRTPADVVRRQLETPLARLHTESRHDGSDAFVSGALAVRETDEGRLLEPNYDVTNGVTSGADGAFTPYSTMAAPAPASREGMSPSVTMEGRMVVITGASLPDIATTASTGREIGEVVDIHPMLAMRRIAWGASGDGCFAFTLEPCDAAIADVVGKGADEALDHLHRMLNRRKDA